MIEGVGEKLHNYEFHDLFTFTIHCYVNQIVGDQMGGACGTRGIDEKCLKTVIDKVEGTRELGNPWHRCRIDDY